MLCCIYLHLPHLVQQFVERLPHYCSQKWRTTRFVMKSSAQKSCSLILLPWQLLTENMTFREQMQCLHWQRTWSLGRKTIFVLTESIAFWERKQCLCWQTALPSENENNVCVDRQHCLQKTETMFVLTKSTTFTEQKQYLCWQTALPSENKNTVCVHREHYL